MNTEVSPGDRIAGMPDLNIIGELTQAGLGRIPVPLPQKYLALPILVPLPPYLKASYWAVRT